MRRRREKKATKKGERRRKRINQWIDTHARLVDLSNELLLLLLLLLLHLFSIVIIPLLCFTKPTLLQSCAQLILQNPHQVIVLLPLSLTTVVSDDHLVSLEALVLSSVCFYHVCHGYAVTSVGDPSSTAVRQRREGKAEQCGRSGGGSLGRGKSEGRNTTMGR